MDMDNEVSYTEDDDQTSDNDYDHNPDNPFVSGKSFQKSSTAPS
jgi:hypothetical protein